MLLNTGATTIQFPSLSVIQTVTGYSGSATQIYTYRIVNDYGGTCSITAGSGGSVPNGTLVLQAYTFAQIVIGVTPSAYYIYSAGISGNAIGQPTGLWYDSVASSVIPNAQFFFYKGPSLSSNVTRPIVRCLDSSSSTYLFFVAWYDTVALLVKGLAFTYNATTAVMTYGSPITIDTMNSIASYPNNVGQFYWLSVAVVSATQALIIYLKDYAGGSVATGYMNMVSVSGLTCTAQTPSNFGGGAPQVAYGGVSTFSSTALVPKFLSGTYFLMLYNDSTTEINAFLINTASGSPVPSNVITNIDGISNICCIDFQLQSPTSFVYWANKTSILSPGMYINLFTITSTSPFTLSSVTIGFYQVGTINTSETRPLGFFTPMGNSYYMGFFAGTASASPFVWTFHQSGSTFTTTNVGFFPTDVETAIPISNGALTYSFFAGTCTVRFYYISGGLVSQGSSISFPYTGALDSSFDLLSSTNRFVICNQVSNGFTTLSGYTENGNISSMIARAYEVVPYGGGTPIIPTPTTTMNVGLLPSTNYYSHTETGEINDVSFNYPGYSGDVAALIGVTNSTGQLLTFES